MSAISAIEAKKYNGHKGLEKYQPQPRMSVLYYTILALSKINPYKGLVERWVSFN